MELYPLLMKPYFRAGAETPWGGTLFRDAFLKDAPEGPVGESLEISALNDRESVVANGIWAGEPVTGMIDMWGRALTGTEDGAFPLLLKLIDAAEPLSVQVHPGNDYAMEHDGKLGKTECWIVLGADSDAKMVYGIDTKGEPLENIVAEGRLEQALRWVRVRPGDVYYIPHGMVHALGGGVQVYEIQQSSDATYRFWDWNRVGADGQPRALHTRAALDVTRPELRLNSLEGTTVLAKGGSRTYYVCDDCFELSRLNVAGTMPLPEGRMLFLTPAEPCRLTWPEGEMELKPFDSVLIPAALGGVALVGTARVFASCLPDRDSLRKELGYRAGNVAGLCD